jgi:hypothetical protein
MRRILPLIIGAALVMVGWRSYHRYTATALAEMEGLPAEPVVEPDSRYRCDGRVHCSQMTSCEEATWFLQHCSGTKMDGEGDGVPCENQWCGHH